MVDKGLPEITLPGDRPRADDESTLAAERRAFLRRAAIAGLPVLLASVRARTVWAQDSGGSLTASANPSLSTDTTAL